MKSTKRKGNNDEDDDEKKQKMESGKMRNARKRKRGRVDSDLGFRGDDDDEDEIPLSQLFACVKKQRKVTVRSSTSPDGGEKPAKTKRKKRKTESKVDDDEDDGGGRGEISTLSCPAGTSGAVTVGSGTADRNSNRKRVDNATPRTENIHTPNDDAVQHENGKGRTTSKTNSKNRISVRRSTRGRTSSQQQTSHAISSVKVIDGDNNNAGEGNEDEKAHIGEDFSHPESTGHDVDGNDNENGMITREKAKQKKKNKKKEEVQSISTSSLRRKKESRVKTATTSTATSVEKNEKKSKVQDVKNNNDGNQEEDRREKGTKKRRKKNEKRKIQETKREMTRKRRGPESSRTCPYCNRVFSIIQGLAYHLKHRVCQTDKVDRGRKGQRGVIRNFPILQPGDVFHTAYGIVQVVADDRIPCDFRQTTRDNDRDENHVKNLLRRASNEKERKRKHQHRVRMHRAKKQRVARAVLNQLYTNAEHERMDKVWRAYGKSKPPFVEREKDGLVLKMDVDCNNHQKGKQTQNGTGHVKQQQQQKQEDEEDPLIPRDSYPNRIVECILLKDERRRLFDINQDVTKDGVAKAKDDRKWIHAVQTQILVRKEKEEEKTDSKKDTHSKDGGDDGAPTTKPAHGGVRLFLKRRLLITPYQPELPVYICQTCGQHFHSWPGLKGHADEKVCLKRAKNQKEEYNERLEIIEKDLDYKVKHHLIVTGEEEKEEQQHEQLRGAVVVKKKRRKVDTEKYSQFACMYPEVYGSLGFRFANNVYKSAARGKVRKELFSHGKKKKKKKKKKKRAKKKEVLATTKSNDMTREGKTAGTESKKHVVKKIKPCHYCVYPEVFTALGFNLTNQSGKATKDGEGTKTMRGSKRKPNKEVADKPKTKKRKKAPRANPKPKEPLVVVDMTVLVEEADAGRYPSIKRFNGEHAETCVICKDGGMLFYCNFCSNAVHLQCFRTSLAVRDPAPGEDFMCPSCVRRILQRRSRAEKRRLAKQKAALDAAGIKATDLTSHEREVLVSGGAVTPIIPHFDPGVSSNSLTEASVPAKEKEAVEEMDDFTTHVPSYPPCPNGGPGGLICCEFCATSYSSMLIDTSREMETQSVAKIGREVSELLELIRDAQVRLRQADEVAKANEIRRSLLDPDQVEVDFSAEAHWQKTRFDL